MNDLRQTTMDTTPMSATQPQSHFNWPRALGSIGLSVVINAVCPYLIYRALAPHYPANDVTPLLVSTVFPMIGLVIGIVRQRMVDVISIISLVEIGISILVTLAAADVRLALIARALQGTLTGVFFLVTALVNRPLFYYVARQFVAASAPRIVAGFQDANRRDEGRTFRRITAFWGVAVIFGSVINLALALTVSPADYLLYSPIFGIGTNVVMIAWTIRTARKRFEGGGVNAP
jgi:hypothetical protein